MRLFASGLAWAALLVLEPAVAMADCECRANGNRYRHGELACLRLPTGDYLARCDMVLNNPAWKKVRDSCPEASAGRSDRAIGAEEAVPMSRPPASDLASG